MSKYYLRICAEGLIKTEITSVDQIYWITFEMGLHEYEGIFTTIFRGRINANHVS